MTNEYHGCERRSRLGKSSYRPTVLPGEELDALTSSFHNLSSSDCVKLAVALVLKKGMRLGELRRLCWHHIDFKDRRLTIPASLSCESRVLSFNDATADLLIACRQAQPSDVFVFGKCPEHRLYCIRRTLAKIADSAIGRPISLHDLRSFFAKLAASGINPMTLTSIAGWSTPKLALRYHSHSRIRNPHSIA